MRLLSKSDAVRAVPNWQYWYCHNCDSAFKRTELHIFDTSTHYISLYAVKCPKCRKSECDPCVWILHCNKEEQLDIKRTPSTIKRACKKCEARFVCYSQRMPL